MEKSKKQKDKPKKTTATSVSNEPQISEKEQITKKNVSEPPEPLEPPEPITEKKDLSKFLKFVLGKYGLNDSEMLVYKLCYRLEPISINEIVNKTNISENEVKDIINQLVSKLLIKKVPDVEEFYYILPPYPIIYDQLTEFSNKILEVKQKIPHQFEPLSKELEKFGSKIQDLQDLIMNFNITNTDLEMVLIDEKIALEENLERLKLEEFIGAVKEFQKHSIEIFKENSEILDRKKMERLDVVDVKFKSMQGTIEESVKTVEKKMGSLANRLDSLKGKISENLEKLRLGVIQKTINEIIEKLILSELDGIKESLRVEFVSIFQNPLDSIYSATQKKFKEGLIEPLNQMIKEISDPISHITEETEVIAENLRQSFAKISTAFNSAISNATKNVEKLGKEPIKEMISPQSILTNTIIKNTDDIFESFNERTVLSSATIKEFWDQSNITINLTDTLPLKTVNEGLSENDKIQLQNQLDNLLKTSDFLITQNQHDSSMQILENCLEISRIIGLDDSIQKIEQKINENGFLKAKWIEASQNKEKEFENQFIVLKKEFEQSIIKRDLSSAEQMVPQISEIKTTTTNGRLKSEIDLFLKQANQKILDLKKIQEGEETVNYSIIRLKDLIKEEDIEEFTTLLNDTRMMAQKYNFSEANSTLNDLEKEMFKILESRKKDSETLSQMIKLVEENRRSQNYQSAIQYCEKVISISKSLKKKEITDEYLKILVELKQLLEEKNKFNQFKQKIKSMSTQALEDLHNGKFMTSSNIYRDIQDEYRAFMKK